MTGNSRGLVDAHAHVFRPAHVLPRAVMDLIPAERDAPAEDLLAQMGSAGVAQCLLVPLDEDDTYVAESVARYPQRFLGLAVATKAEKGLTDEDPVAAIQEHRRRFPFVALRTGWLGPVGEPIEASPMFPVFEYLASEGIVLWAYLGAGQLSLVAELAQRLPTLRIVLNHLGLVAEGMWVDEALRPAFDDALPAGVGEAVANLARFPNIHLMFSGLYALSREEPPYPELRDTVRRLVTAYSPERTLWGSDYPWVRDVPGYTATRNVVQQVLSDFNDSQIDRILGGTARSLLPFAAHEKGTQ